MTAYGLTIPLDGPLHANVTSSSRCRSLATPTCGRPRPAAPTHSLRWSSPRRGRRRCGWARRSCRPLPGAPPRSRRAPRRSPTPHPGRVAIGIGSSSDIIVQRWNGIAFDRPYERVRDVVRFLREALTGQKITETYDTFTVDGFRLLGAGGGTEAARRRAAPGHAPPRRKGGRRRDPQLALRRRRALGSPRMCTRAARTRRSWPASSSRPPPTAMWPATVARQAIAGYLTVPVYRAFHEWLGRTDLLGSHVERLVRRRPQGRRGRDPGRGRRRRWWCTAARIRSEPTSSATSTPGSTPPSLPCCRSPATTNAIVRALAPSPTTDRTTSGSVTWPVHVGRQLLASCDVAGARAATTSGKL